MELKKNQFLLAVLVLQMAVGPCFGDTTPSMSSKSRDGKAEHKVSKPPSGKRITAEELAEKRRKVDGNRQYIRVRNEIIQEGRSIYDSSVILATNGTHTVLPEGAVAFIPRFHASKVVDKPLGKFVLWPEFYNANRAWLRTLDLSLDQVKGIEPVNEQRIKALRSAGVVIVTQYEKHPTSFRGTFELPVEEQP